MSIINTSFSSSSGRFGNDMADEGRPSKVYLGFHISWCPAAEFTLLPLHAAGFYEKKRDNLSHTYIFSYTPTLATMAAMRPTTSCCHRSRKPKRKEDIPLCRFRRIVLHVTQRQRCNSPGCTSGYGSVHRVTVYTKQ